MNLNFLPRDEGAERCLLGIVLEYSESLAPRFCAEVDPAAFCEPSRVKIAEAIFRLHAERIPCEIGRVLKWLQDARQPEAVTELMECAAVMAIPAHFTHYAERVVAVSKARALWHAAADIMKSVEALGLTDDPETLLVNAAERIEQLQSSSAGDAWRRLDHLWLDQIDAIQDSLNGSGKTPVERMPFGMPGLDSIVDGAERGRLLVIGAQTHVGKTALARSIACEMGSRYKVGWFGMESSCEEEGITTMSYVSGVNQASLKRGILTKGEHDDLLKALRFPRDVHIDDTPGLNSTEIASRARTLKRRSGLDVLIVDYVQLMGQAGASRNSTREQMISEDARRLKVLAGSLKILVVALAQVNDELPVTAGPDLSHFRESKAISKHADYVLTMSAPDGIAPDDNGGPVARDLWIRKWRGKGAKARPVRLKLHGETQRFTPNTDEYPATSEPAPAPRNPAGRHRR